jgi:peroxiredoxin
MSAPFAISYAALWALVVLQALLLIGLTRLVHQLREGRTADAARAPQRGEGERLAGQLAPLIDGVDVNGTRVRSDELGGPLNAILFVSPRCSNCMVSLDELNALRHKVDGHVMAVCLGTADECRLLVEDLDLTMPVVADPDQRISASFDVTHTPTAVTVNKRGRIVQYGHPGRDAELEALLQQLGRPIGEEGREHA